MIPRLLVAISLSLALLGVGGALMATRLGPHRASARWELANRGHSDDELAARRQALRAFQSEMIAAGLEEVAHTRSTSDEGGAGALAEPVEEHVTLRGSLPDLGPVTVELVTRGARTRGGPSVSVQARVEHMNGPAAQRAWDALQKRLNALNNPPPAE